MTTKPPNTSALTPDTQSEVIARVTLDEILDSSGALVDKNSVTFDPILELRGTAAPDRELNIRDRSSSISNVTSGSTGNWNKELDFQQGFKRYSLSAIETKRPYDFSTSYTFVLATETPIIDKVTGKDGPIESGAIYDGDWLVISGYAPPDMEVVAFNSDTSTGKKATVDRDGLFNLTFDGITAGTYSIKIKATNGKASSVFEFRVVSDVKLILCQVSDSQGVIPEGDTTYDDRVIVRGYGQPGEDVQLRNNGSLIDGATATARDDDGLWEIEIDVTPGAYSLTAQALYGDGEISEPPRNFTVESILKPHNTRVYDSDGLIEDNGSTPYNHVIARGNAAPLAQIWLKINGVIDPRPEQTDDTGKWARLVNNLNAKTTYTFFAVANYGDNAESDSWTITTG
ncbi:carboxypeptidase-like regulatory domain-containing protein [Pseudomonas sp. P5_109]|uniref:carboxypeptidase-like regulatory domain-containing protein n=1 Tax=unclassified Pseudomonas TaxID=196821 RepID=UPI001CBA78B1|nr:MULTISPECIES: carboxypeptidase-like regulatory domain-containing protein [unclassified Pseudomonas]WPN31589.1 carboxypeptidase-like regulatory domain-containing protein [Pseudomonas sp. P5_109]